MSDEKVELNIAKPSVAGMAALFQRLTGKPAVQGGSREDPQGARSLTSSGTGA